MNILIYLKDRSTPIQTTLNNTDLDGLTNALNGKILFLKIGNETVHRDLILKIVEVMQTAAENETDSNKEG